MRNMICGEKTKFSFKLLLLILCISRTEIPRKINGKGLMRSLHLLSDISRYIFCYFRPVSEKNKENMLKLMSNTVLG